MMLGFLASNWVSLGAHIQLLEIRIGVDLVLSHFVRHEGKNYKLIDDGSCVNIIGKTTFEKMGFKTEPYPYIQHELGLMRLLNLLPNIVRFISTFLATRIVFGVTS